MRKWRTTTKPANMAAPNLRCLIIFTCHRWAPILARLLA